jgi:hypothetical protein
MAAIEITPHGLAELYAVILRIAGGADQHAGSR